MSPVAIVIIVVAVVAGIVVLIIRQMRFRRMKEEGKVVKRSYAYEREAEIFTLSNADFGKVVEALQQTDLSKSHISWGSSGESQTISFQTYCWKAELFRLENEGELFRYQFQFTHWETHNGGIKNYTNMNVLLTAVEKLFLQLDPNTKVATERQKVHSKPNFF